MTKPFIYALSDVNSQAYAQAGWGQRTFPLAERMASQVLSLPMGPHLGHENAEQVLSAIRRFLAAP